jgi:adenylosuccinate synthase
MADKYLLLLSGPIAVGKTAIRQSLVAKHGFDYVRSGQYLAEMADRRSLDAKRVSLQDLGDELDLQTDFRWLLDDVAIPGFRDKPQVNRWIIDAVRKPRQVTHVRGMDQCPLVLHAHLIAPEETLEKRYEERRAKQANPLDVSPYAIAIDHPNERSSRELISIADAIYDTSLMGSDQISEQIVDWFSKRSI